jgi:peptidoglycan hydrolase-like protein with peptidoglycan-binding domain
VNLAINDTNYGDNTGELAVTVFQGFTGVTGENGCVTFEDVPYGTYEVAELMQAGFENTSGLGPDVVDEDKETFTVENNDLSFVPPCELELVSGTNTLVSETNEFAVATYSHTSWTDDIDDATWVWATEYVENPEDDETYTFVETFTADGATSAMLDVAADNTLLVKVNGAVVLDRTTQNNFMMPHTNVDILSALNPTGENIIEFIVKNEGVEKYNRFRNPAGVLYKLTLSAADNCAVTTQQSSLEITNPAVDGEVLAGTSTFMAEYQDQDLDADTVYWAIRAGSCSGTDMVGNAPASPFHLSTFNTVTGEFETTVDMSTWANGQYCLVVNPREDNDAFDERETRTFMLQNQIPETPDTFTIQGVKWDDVNGNGILDDEESTLSGWNMFLTEEGSQGAPEQATTDKDGAYSFAVSAGTWVVTEESELGWTQTGQYQNGDVVPSDSDTFGSCVLTIPSEDVQGTVYTCSFGNQENLQIDTVSEPDADSNGGGGGDATRIRRVDRPEPLVLGVTTDAPQMCPFLTEYMQISAANDTMEVMKLQAFLNIFKGLFGGTENPITGTFGSITDANVKAFQETYRTEVLDPWFEQGIVPHDRPTGYVYKTTLWKINSMVCPDGATYPDFSGENLLSNVDNDINDIVKD